MRWSFHTAAARHGSLLALFRSPAEYTDGSIHDHSPSVDITNTACGETLSHLEHMVMEGMVEHQFEDGKVKYVPVKTVRRN